MYSGRKQRFQISKEYVLLIAAAIHSGPTFLVYLILLFPPFIYILKSSTIIQYTIKGRFMSR